MDAIMIGWQTFYALSMFFATLFSYVSPIVVIRRRSLSSSLQCSGGDTHAPSSVSQTLSACNCFAAGIFLGICFLNLVPYCEREFDTLFDAIKYSTDFPVAMFTVILGLFLLFTLETVIMNCRNGSQPPVLRLDDHDINDSLHEEQIQELLDVENREKCSSHDNDTNSSSTTIESRTELRNHNHFSHSIAQHVGHSHAVLPPHTASSSMFSFFVLMFATSVHSVFEGLALGLQKDSGKAMHLFIGIILHECLVAFALGLNSARFNSTLRDNFRFGMAFSATIPFGIVLGLVLGYAPGLLGRSVSAVFQGLAAGTFIYVTFHELIPSEFMTENQSSDHILPVKGYSKLSKICLLFLGFMAMAAMTALSDSH